MDWPKRTKSNQNKYMINYGKLYKLESSENEKRVNNDQKIDENLTESENVKK